MRDVVSDDRLRLSNLADVEFTDEDVAELAQHAVSYSKRWRDIEDIPDWMLLQMPTPDPQKLRMEARRVYVEIVECLWRECRGRGSGAYIRKAPGDPDDPDAREKFDGFDGRLIRLLEDFFAVAGDPQNRATLYHDLQQLYKGRERQRSKKRPRP